MGLVLDRLPPARFLHRVRVRGREEGSDGWRLPGSWSADEHGRRCRADGMVKWPMPTLLASCVSTLFDEDGFRRVLSCGGHCTNIERAL